MGVGGSVGAWFRGRGAGLGSGDRFGDVVWGQGVRFGVRGASLGGRGAEFGVRGPGELEASGFGNERT